MESDPPETSIGAHPVNTAPPGGDARRGDTKAGRRDTDAAPLRVLQVVPSLERGGGGVERSTIDVAAAITETGGTAIVASAGGQLVRELERAGVEHVTLPLAGRNPFTMRANVDRLCDLIKAHEINILHARSRAPAWSALAAAHRTATRFITTFHGTYSHGNRLKRFYNSVMLRGDLVIANSHFIADHIKATYAINQNRIRVIPRGVDQERFAPERVSAERVIQLAQRWNLPDDSPVIMLAGRLTRWKGHNDLIDALAKLDRLDLRCLLVGADQGRTRYHRELEQRIADHGLDSVIQLTGQCDDMPAAYMLADVVVSASTDPEAFGRVVAEAQSMGRPVVVSNHGGAAEQIEHGNTGWCYPPGDASGLALALAEALALEGTRRELMAARATARVRSHYTKTGMTAATLETYAELLKRRGPTAPLS